MKGVVATGVGYTGGTTSDPTYSKVCGGGTGHAEAVRVRFDPSVISYEQLLREFFQAHDPTRGRDGAKGQYRMAVFAEDAEQERTARSVARSIEVETHRPFVAAIEPAGPFFLAEEYHQLYFEKAGGGACSL